MARGAAWMVLFKLSERSLGLISTIILARLLVPADFGLIAMAMSMIAALELLSAFGFDMALIQNRTAETRHYDTAWTLNVLFGTASALILLILARPAAQFYEEARVAPVMYWLALGTLLQGFENVGVVAFRKEMQFNREFNFLVAKKIAAFAVTVPMAFAMRNYWALVAGMLTGRITGVLLSYRLHPYRPWFSLSGLRDLLYFSKWLLINNISLFLRLRSVDFIIGRVSGPRALGLFSISYEISNLPTTELIAPINRAVYPGYARQAGNLLELGQTLVNVLAMIALLALPIGAGIASIAQPLVILFLGHKWVQTAPLIQILAWAGVANAIQSNFTYIYLALGRPRTTTLLSGAYIAVLIPALILAAHAFGVVGAAWAYFSAALIFLPASYFLLASVLNLRLQQLTAVVWRPLVATTMMVLLVRVFMGQPLVAADTHVVALQLATAVVLGAVTYGISLTGLWLFSGRPPGAEQYLLERLTPRFKSAFRILGY